MRQCREVFFDCGLGRAPRARLVAGGGPERFSPCPSPRELAREAGRPLGDRECIRGDPRAGGGSKEGPSRLAASGRQHAQRWRERHLYVPHVDVRGRGAADAFGGHMHQVHVGHRGLYCSVSAANRLVALPAASPPPWPE